MNSCNVAAFTSWKVSKYGVISGLYFPVFGLNTGKYGPENTLYLDIFHAVSYKFSWWLFKQFFNPSMIKVVIIKSQSTDSANQLNGFYVLRALVVVHTSNFRF